MGRTTPAINITGHEPLFSAAAIEQAAKAAANGKLPPVDRWDPPFCGDIDMRIARDGTWFHEGTPIGRIGLVRMFSTVLRRMGDQYFLVTPVERVGITVEDVPFVAVDFTASGTGADQVLTFTTALGDSVAAGPDHRLHFLPPDQRPFSPPAPAAASDDRTPYIDMRDGLWARIDRKSFYRLVDLAVPGPDGNLGLWSGGVFFDILTAGAPE